MGKARLFGQTWPSFQPGRFGNGQRILQAAPFDSTPRLPECLVAAILRMCLPKGLAASVTAAKKGSV